MTPNKEICDLARILLDSTCTHVAYHISKEKNRWAYVRAMSRCYYLCSEQANGNNLLNMRRELVTLRRSAPKRFRKRWFSHENGYYLMGVNHSIYVVDSIITRFVKGYSASDEVFIRNMLTGIKKE